MLTAEISTEVSSLPESPIHREAKPRHAGTTRRSCGYRVFLAVRFSIFAWAVSSLESRTKALAFTPCARVPSPPGCRDVIE
jgi:hypothetical protein